MTFFARIPYHRIGMTFVLSPFADRSFSMQMKLYEIVLEMSKHQLPPDIFDITGRQRVILTIQRLPHFEASFKYTYLLTSYLS